MWNYTNNPLSKTQEYLETWYHWLDLCIQAMLIKHVLLYMHCKPPDCLIVFPQQTIIGSTKAANPFHTNTPLTSQTEQYSSTDHHIQLSGKNRLHINKITMGWVCLRREATSPVLKICLASSSSPLPLSHTHTHVQQLTRFQQQYTSSFPKPPTVF